MRTTLLVLALGLGACGSVTSAPPDAPAAAADAPRADARPPDGPPPPDAPVNLIQNGDFSQGTLDWTPVNTSLSIVNGALELQQTADVGPGLAWQLVYLDPTKKYKLTATLVGGSYPMSYHVRAGTQTNDATFATFSDPTMPAVFTPTQTAVWITLNNVSAKTGEYAIFDDVTLVETP